MPATLNGERPAKASWVDFVRMSLPDMGMFRGISYRWQSQEWAGSTEACSLWHDPQYSNHLANGRVRREDVSQKALYMERSFLELQEENTGVPEGKGRPCHVFNQWHTTNSSAIE